MPDCSGGPFHDLAITQNREWPSTAVPGVASRSPAMISFAAVMGSAPAGCRGTATAWFSRA
jgi:hypothetical protein